MTSERASLCYDAPTMHSIRSCVSLIITALLLPALGPLGAGATDAVVAAAPLTLTVSRAIGAEAVIVAGTSRTARTLEATLYATFSRDLPAVVLSRRTLAVAANGTYSSTMPTAPAYFRDAVISVVVRSVADDVTLTAHITVAAPNIESPADAHPR